MVPKPLSKIAAYSCEQYDTEQIKTVFRKALQDIEFDLSSMRNMRIAIKPNLLRDSSPEKGVVTHPVFFQAAVQLVKENGGIPILVESPAVHSLDRVFKKTGYDEIIRNENVEVSDTSCVKVVYNEHASRFKRFELAADAVDADMIVNLPKFKTHGITYITAAVKNLFGTIHGLDKSQWHLRASTKEEFATILLDLYDSYIHHMDKTILHLVDAITVLEGEGPGPSGTPKSMNVIVAGLDAIAVDYILSKLVQIDVNLVHTVKMGDSRGLGQGREETISILGDPVDLLQVEDFQPTKSSLSSDMMRWPFTSPVMRSLFVQRPVPSEEKCTLCYQCKSICPAGAISRAAEGEKIPAYDYKKCIRCYCCMEICPESAIDLKKGKLQWIFNIVSP
ncbi:MAG TPA: DUF362 domain-containing protein [Spirochaetota bacterium]|nr:DUF362 domain-containing protein [Spirochaetota bacterium]